MGSARSRQAAAGRASARAASVAIYGVTLIVRKRLSWRARKQRSAHCHIVGPPFTYEHDSANQGRPVPADIEIESSSHTQWIASCQNNGGEGREDRKHQSKRKPDGIVVIRSSWNRSNHCSRGESGQKHPERWNHASIARGCHRSSEGQATSGGHLDKCTRKYQGASTGDE